ncbi:MAG: DUF3179 domain-containing protein [Pseudomonadota bacterium]
MPRLIALLTALVLSIATPLTAFAQQNTIFSSENPPETTEEFVEVAVQGLVGTTTERRNAVDLLVAEGKSMIPTLVLMLNISGNHVNVAKGLKQLTGETLKDWRAAMLYQEAHPEIIPHPSYRGLKLRYFTSIDPRFMQFFPPQYSSRDKMKIRFEEIAWGGVRVDGIPSLDNPKLLPAAKAEYLRDDDLVFGVSINGDARAYPLRIMGWHEMFNEVIGGVPVALAYCTLCGSGILFETQVEGRDEPLVFGSSGFLYRSNKLMFDRATNSLWNQFTGEPVSGPLVDEGIKLKIRPVAITSWKAWREANPKTQVLSLETGHYRDYGSGVVYREYFASPDLMFPTIVRDESRIKRKDYVFGIREFGAAKAWPLKAFEKERIINDRVGQTDVVLIGDPLTRTVRAYERGGRTFSMEKGVLVSDRKRWAVTEDALKGPKNKTLARVPGHIAYWFAWDGYLGVESALYDG